VVTPTTLGMRRAAREISRGLGGEARGLKLGSRRSPSSVTLAENPHAYGVLVRIPPPFYDSDGLRSTLRYKSSESVKAPELQAWGFPWVRAVVPPCATPACHPSTPFARVLRLANSAAVGPTATRFSIRVVIGCVIAHKQPWGLRLRSDAPSGSPRFMLTCEPLTCIPIVPHKQQEKRHHQRDANKKTTNIRTIVTTHPKPALMHQTLRRIAPAG
jgi:hypothetical protein